MTMTRYSTVSTRLRYVRPRNVNLWFAGLCLIVSNCSDRPTNPPHTSTHEIENSLPSKTQAPSPSPSEAKTGEYEIEVRKERVDTFVDIHPNQKDTPALDWRPRSKGLFVRWDRNLPRPAQVEMLRGMVEQLHEREGAALSRATVHVPLDCFSYPDYVKRLARFASTDPHWLKRKESSRRPRPDPALGLHQYIVEATNAGSLTPELDGIFAPLGMGTKPHLNGVEKCSESRPNTKNELGRWLLSHGFTTKRALPMGCLMSWFELRVPE